jgi:hypothetical protein
MTQGHKTILMLVLISYFPMFKPLLQLYLLDFQDQDVTRRFKDNDPIGRVACQLLERALEYELEHYTDYKTAMDSAVFDRMIGGRGTAWVRYEPHIVAKQQGLPEDGYEVSEVVEGMDEEDENGQEPSEEI